MISRSTNVRAALRSRQRGFLLNPARFGGGGGGGATPDIVRMLFNGADNGSVFTDDGTGASTWTRTASSVFTSTTTPVEGTASLRVTASNQELFTSYGSNNELGSGDFFIGFWLKPDGTTSQRYVMAVEASPYGATNRAFLFVYSLSNVLQFYLSNGTTVPVLNLGTTSGAAFQYIRVERVGNTIYGSIGNATPVSTAFTGSVNLPSGGIISIGESGGLSGVGSFNMDMLQIKRNNVYGGAAIPTPPTSPI